MKKYKNEFKVVFFVILSLIGLLYLTLSTGKFYLTEKGYNIYVEFVDILGLEKNAPVMLNGLEVGRVEDIKVSYQDERLRTILKLLIPKGIKIWHNPVVSIKTLGLMGEKYVHIKSYAGKSFVEPDSVLMGENPLDMDALFSEAEILSKKVNLLVEEVKKLAQTLNETVTENRQSLYATIQSLENTGKNLEAFSEDVKKHPWKLLFKTKEKKPKGGKEKQ